MRALRELFIPAWQKEVEASVDIPSLAHTLSPPFDNPTLLYSMARLALKLKPMLSSYDTILGDDAGGRIPALLYAHLATQKRLQGGKEKPNVFFIHPIQSLTSDYAKFEKFLSSHKEQIGSVLFVTEYVQSGTHAGVILDFLSEHKITWSIAAVSVLYHPATYKFREGLIYGSIGDLGKQAFHDNFPVSGAQTQEDAITSHGYTSSMGISPTVNQARVDVAAIAEAFIPLVA